MTLLVITRREEMKLFIQEQKLKKNKIGFVPTMGALHKGHLSLIQKSTSENEVTIVSIFVNPTQFGANEDLSKYPRQFQKDYELCLSNGVQAIFSPTVSEMYPSGFSTQISVNNYSNFMCGKFRPGHFEGVATVVMLLLNIVQPHLSYFGQKDFQQVQIIKKMCQDLASEHKIIMVPTIREEDGLALSSRNVYLSPDAKKLALTIPCALAAAAKLFLSGERSAVKIIESAQIILKSKEMNPQYLELRSVLNLTKKVESNIDEDCVLAIAQIVQSEEMQVRLIDNIILSEDSMWNRVLQEFSDITRI